MGTKATITYNKNNNGVTGKFTMKYIVEPSINLGAYVDVNIGPAHVGFTGVVPPSCIHTVNNQVVKDEYLYFDSKEALITLRDSINVALKQCEEHDIEHSNLVKSIQERDAEINVAIDVLRKLQEARKTVVDKMVPSRKANFSNNIGVHELYKNIKGDKA